MPEGPEIRLAADRVEQALLGRPVTRIEFAFPHLQRFAKALRGRQVTRVATRGKAMLTHFDNDFVIFSHNQLYGRWVVCNAYRFPKTARQLRLAIHNAHKSALLYSASEIDVLTPDQIAVHPFLSSLGPDVVSADREAVLAQVRSPRFQRRHHS